MKMFRSAAWRVLCLATILLANLCVPTGAQAAAGVTGNIVVNIDGRYSGAPTIGSSGSDLGLHNAFGFTPGTTSGKADLLFASSRTLAASATENLDLAGSLADPLGATLTFAKVKAIYVKAACGNTNSVVIGGAAANTFTGPFADATDKVSVAPCAVLMIMAPTAGWTVTAATGDILKVANSAAGSSVTYEVVIIGTSA